MGLKTFGLMGVDWEERVNLERLRQDRLNRIKTALKESERGSLLCFDMNNIRYITATHIGTWAMDKLVRFSLLPQDDEPIVWDFGSAARHHQITARGWPSVPARAFRPCAARPIRLPVWPTTWRKKSNWNSINANCSMSRWGSMSSNSPCCSPCRRKESKSSMASSSCTR